ncbi:Levansucrase [Croceibacterium atlanticum]|uniref:Levansucrase n=1 Tax=Croceibacterium atlanticum TaxID=1267766 RepID=A0A0F7KLJ1_9SPHN|nr:Levansucrase [Croceibacterium atlanticum]
MKGADFPAVSSQPAEASLSAWTPDHVKSIGADGACQTAPVLTQDDFARIASDVDFWDAWPIQEAAGMPARLADGSTLWMALGAPHFPDPEMRHGHARIHLLRLSGDEWQHLGHAMPDGFSPGSREWSGSAVLDGQSDTVTLYFTAAGRKGEAEPSFLQRMFVARATLGGDCEAPCLVDWRDLEEVVQRDPAQYMASEAGSGRIGTIKAFRDPAFFHDDKSGRDYLFFAASAAQSSSAFNGVIGVAAAQDDAGSDWETLPPVVSADGLNNELERPHVVRHEGLYYLFWSTQSHVFDPQGPVGPTGLYGMVSENLLHGWHPLNGSSLVFANPPEAPRQAYSWFVMPDLQVTSFVDDWGTASQNGGPRRFGATFAPMLQLWLDGDKAGLVKQEGGDGAAGRR